jgi:L,D-peptidoglycan transpeptidase YkuD (ErfK/YbiS/YcfS/YnhG family)
MIIINKSGYLKFKNLKFKCSLGKAGIGVKKIEGDNMTPKGTYRIIKIYYRKDRIKKLSSKIKLVKINKKIGWCDDPKSKKYNKQITLPYKYNHEKLYRKDNIYDIVLVLNYNINPIIKNKGSAIFIHVARKNYNKTKGCIAIKKKNLMRIVNLLKKDSVVKIN